VDRDVDEELVRRAREGDQEALQALLNRHTLRLLGRIKCRIEGSVMRKVAPSDILQEARLVAAERLAEFEDRGEGSFRHWLEKIVELKIREAVRRYAGTGKREVGREVTRSRLPKQEPASAGPTPSEVAMGEELREAARLALEKLSPDQRRVLTLLRDRRLSVETAAGRLGRSPGAVKKLYGRALARLEELLDLGPEAGGARRRPTR
jgi:RNA polymerase sigma-70 factor (ECF subfamily)